MSEHRLTIPFALSLVRLQVVVPAAQGGSAAVERALRQRLDPSLTVTRNATGFDISTQLHLVEPDGTAGLAPPAFAEWMTSAVRTVWETAAKPRPDRGRPTEGQSQGG